MSVKPPRPPAAPGPVLPDVYWVTRDQVDGHLSSAIEIWAVKPHPVYPGDGDVIWLAPIDMLDRGTARLYQWSVAETMLHVRVVPETPRECIRVGR